MNGEPYELDRNAQLLNLQLLGYQGVIGASQGIGGSCGAPYWVQHCPCPSSPRDYEISIEQITGAADPLLNYGAKLRLLIADPIKGIDLREALHKLKTALQEAIQI